MIKFIEIGVDTQMTFFSFVLQQTKYSEIFAKKYERCKDTKYHFGLADVCDSPRLKVKGKNFTFILIKRLAILIFLMAFVTKDDSSRTIQLGKQIAHRHVYILYHYTIINLELLIIVLRVFLSRIRVLYSDKIITELTVVMLIFLDRK